MDSLSQHIPAVYLEQDDGSTAAFVSAFDETHDTLEAAIGSIPTVNEPRRAPLTFQNDISNHFGSPFFFMTNERWQEGAKAENLMIMYGLRGSAAGIRNVVHYLTGIAVDVYQDFQYCWELDVSQLGGATPTPTTGFGSAFGSAFGS